MPDTISTSQNLVPETQNPILGWCNCLDCEDLGVCCNGPSLISLGSIASARAYHKSLCKHRNISVKKVAEVAKKTISEATVYEYFSGADKDFKWTTVFQICVALVSIVGNRVGMPPLTAGCPASSAEMRAHMAAADMKIAAAELRAAQSETALTDMQAQIIEVKARSAERIDQMEADHTKAMDRRDRDIRTWQCFSYALLALVAFQMLVIVFR